MSLPPERLATVSFATGLDGETFAFWPMLFGGLFLYAAYYGCDQSQAQRILASRDEADMNRVLLINGLFRFPLVLLYCLLGLALASYALQHPELIDALPRKADGSANFNLIFPTYVLEEFPAGLTGLVIIGIIAAAMSSIDSALNALSASVLEDYIDPNNRLAGRQRLWVAKGATIAWGVFAVAFSYSVEWIAPTVLEAVNKVGSMVNGPLLALFVIAWLAPAVGQSRALTAFAVGVCANAALWLWAPQVSWLWWNVTGALVALSIALPGVPLERPRVSDQARTPFVLSCAFGACLLAVVVLAPTAFAT